MKEDFFFEGIEEKLFILFLRKKLKLDKVLRKLQKKIRFKLLAFCNHILECLRFYDFPPELFEFVRLFAIGNNMFKTYKKL